jgi:DNA adenine methylase
VKTHQTLLRYPGGKSRAVAQLLNFFPAQPGVLVSPFFGGGALELALAACGWRVLGFDAYQPVVDFWQQALTDPQRLAAEVAEYHPLTLEGFKRLQAEVHQLPTQWERAAAFYVLNRTSFNGTTCSGGMSLRQERFTRRCIKKLSQFSAPNVWVEQADFMQSIRKHPNDFLFLDPPYINARKLYGRNGDLHDRFDHEALRNLLKDRGQWVLCYGDCPEARCLYGDRRVVPLQWKYGMNRSKQSKEVVILSDDLPVPDHHLDCEGLPVPTTLADTIAVVCRELSIPLLLTPV